MSKAVNTALVEDLAKELQDEESCVLVGCRDLTVAEVSELRTNLRAQNFKMRVVKNTLASVSFEKANMPGLGKMLDGPSAVVYGGEGAIAISKVLVKEAKELGEKLVIHGGFNEGEIVDAQGVDVLSKVPGRQELLSMILSGFFGPVNNLHQGMNGLLTEMHGLIEAFEKKQAESGAA